MKVTFVCPLNANLTPGGAEQQARQTAIELKRLGVDVEFLSPLTNSLGDIVHAFGPYAEYERMLAIARHQNKPFVTSTIFYKDFTWIDSLKYRARAQVSGHENRSVGKLFRKSDRLLPNTRAELEQVAKLHGIRPDRAEVVPNGAETRFYNATPDLFRSHFGITEDFVLNVGRIEHRKNQLRLAEAAKSLRKRLVLIGQDIDSDYFNQVMNAGGEYVTYLGPIPHDDSLLESAYAACRVFALPSTFETPGIAALEAGMAGAKVIATPFGGPKEYFLDDAIYPDITRTSAIAEAITKMWDMPKSTKLKERLHAEYGWPKIAERTLRVYLQVLEGKS